MMVLIVILSLNLDYVNAASQRIPVFCALDLHNPPSEINHLSIFGIG
jgi:hypothetical protein